MNGRQKAILFHIAATLAWLLLCASQRQPLSELEGPGSLLTITSATVSWYSQRPVWDNIYQRSAADSDPTDFDHGLILSVQGSSECQFWTQIRLDIKGKFWSSLPLGSEFLARTGGFLPLSLNRDSWNCPRPLGMGQVDMVIAAKRSHRAETWGIKHSTIRSTLNTLVAAGDMPMIVEVTGLSGRRAVASFETKPSLILQSLGQAGPQNIVSNEKPLIVPPTRLWLVFAAEVFRLFKWLILPTLFSLATAAVTLGGPESTLRTTLERRLRVRLWTTDQSRKIPLPTLRSESLMLGRLIERWHNPQISQEQRDQILLSCSDLLAMSQRITAEEFESIELLISLSDQRRASSKPWGLLSVVNVIWLLSIIGILVSVGPTIHELVFPLRRFLVLLMERIFFDLILPALRHLHDWGLMAVFCWILSFCISLQGLWARPRYSSFLSLSGVGLAWLSFIYTSTLFGPSWILGSRYQACIFLSWIVLTSVPWALELRSSLFALLATACLEGSVAFLFGPGHHKYNPLSGIETGSMVLVAIQVILAVSGHLHTTASVFRAPLHWLGEMFFVMAQVWRGTDLWTEHKGGSFFTAQIGPIATIAILGGVGVGTSSESTMATSIAGGLAWGVAMYCELFFKWRINGWVFVFFTSLILWQTALSFHKHTTAWVFVLRSLFSLNNH